MLTPISLISTKAQDETKVLLRRVSHMKLESCLVKNQFSLRNGKYAPCFLVNLPAFYHKCRSLIGCPAVYCVANSG